jgi:hypothetical protein
MAPGVIVLSKAGLAADLSVTVAESIDNVNFEGTFGLAINSTSTSVSETVTVDGNPRTISLPAGPYTRLTATNTTLSTDVLTVSGNVTFETTGTGSSREILVGATSVSGFLGDNGGTVSDTSDDTGVRLANGTLLGVVGASGTLALNATGNLSLLGLPQLTFAGNAILEINSTASRVTRSLNVGGVNRTLDVAPSLERLALRNVLATFTDFVELTGDFSVERIVSGSTTTLQLAASGIGAFLAQHAVSPMNSAFASPTPPQRSSSKSPQASPQNSPFAPISVPSPSPDFQILILTASRTSKSTASVVSSTSASQTSMESIFH